MSHTQDFLVEIAQNAGIRPTAYAIGKHMTERYGWSKNTAANYMTGNTFPDERRAMDIASELGIDPMYVIACAQADRASDLEIHRIWEGMAERLRNTAAAVILSALVGLVGLAGTTAPSGAYASTSAEPAQASSPLRAMLRRLFRWFAQLLEDTGDLEAA